jgi:hypothetical protein
MKARVLKLITRSGVLRCARIGVIGCDPRLTTGKDTRLRPVFSQSAHRFDDRSRSQALERSR